MNSENKSFMLIRLRGPSLSSGMPGQKNRKPTYEFPSKSMLVGIIGSAMGIDRHDVDAIAEISTLWVKCLRLKTGYLRTDYQTVGASFGKRCAINAPLTSTGEIRQAAGLSIRKDDRKPVETRRDFLDDVDFVFFCEGDTSLVRRCENALNEPRHVLFLGRKRCLPSVPILADVFGSREEAEARLWEITREAGLSSGDTVAFVSDADVDSCDDVLMDFPVEFGLTTGGYRRRYVCNGLIEIP